MEGTIDRQRPREQDEATIAGESGNAGRTFLFPFSLLMPARLVPGRKGSLLGCVGGVMVTCMLSRSTPGAGSLGATKNPKVFTFGVNVAMANQPPGEAA